MLIQDFATQIGEISMPNVHGGESKLSEYQDSKAIVIIFTCNHCPYAIKYEDRIKSIHEAYQTQAISLIAISSNDAERYPQDSFERMQERAREKGFNFPYLYDESQEVAKAFGASHTPHAFLLAPQSGNMWQIMYSGAIDDNFKNEHLVQKSYLKEQLDSLLGQNLLTWTSTPPIGCTIKWRQ